jgi:hypothetical protein
MCRCANVPMYQCLPEPKARLPTYPSLDSPFTIDHSRF